MQFKKSIVNDKFLEYIFPNFKFILKNSNLIIEKKFIDNIPNAIEILKELNYLNIFCENDHNLLNNLYCGKRKRIYQFYLPLYRKYFYRFWYYGKSRQCIRNPC